MNHSNVNHMNELHAQIRILQVELEANGYKQFECPNRASISDEDWEILVNRNKEIRDEIHELTQEIYKLQK